MAVAVFGLSLLRVFAASDDVNGLGFQIGEVVMEVSNSSAGETGAIRRVFEPDTREVIGCAIDVHRELGPGFVESVYQNALIVSLHRKGIPFESERGVTVWYHGVEVGHHRLDMVVRSRVVVEIKAVQDLAEIHFAQLRSYLRASGLGIGLLLNFKAPMLEIRRVVNRVELPAKVQ
jgi:GxxExxY protein